MAQILLPFEFPSSKGRKLKPIFFCVYCGLTASTRDHVPPVSFLEKPLPNNLRTVPACRSCNESWSSHEQYMAVVLALIGHRPNLMAKLDENGVIDRTLMASAGLDAMIINSLTPDEDGRVSFKVDLDRIAIVTNKIAYGLFCLKYGLGTSSRLFSTLWISGPGQEIPPNFIAAQWIRPGLRRKRWTVVQSSSFSFLFAKGWMTGDPPLYCMMNFHDTIFVAVGCPPPVGRKSGKRLRSKPWGSAHGFKRGNATPPG
jgi:hypothetical protein